MMDMEQLDTLVSQGLDAYQDGNYAKALKKFEKVLGSAPDDDAVRNAAAVTANKAGAWKSAATHWLEISRQNTRRAGPVNQYISALLNARNFSEARAYCETSAFLQAKANRPRYYSVMMKVSLSEGKLGDAKKLADSGYEITPNDPTALEYASHFFDHKHYAEMGAWIGRIKDRIQHEAAINFLQARAFYAQKQWDKAAETWEKVLEQADERQADSARLYLARIALNTGNHKAAEMHFDLVLQKYPRHEEAISFLIRSQMLDNNDTAARALIDEHWEILDPIRRVQYKARTFTATDPMAGVQVFLDALEVQPENFALKIGYASYLLDLKDIEAAEEKLLGYLQEQPEHYELNRLYLRLMQVKPSPVDQQLKQAKFTLALDPSSVSLLNTVGGLLAQNNRRADAVRHYQDAVITAPSEAVLWRNGAYHLAMENRLEDAGRFAEAAIETLGTTSAEQLTNAAWIMLAAQQTRPALEFANQAIALNPNSATAHEMAADLQMDEGRYDLAWRHIQKIDALVFPRRSEKIAHLGAKCVAAFRGASSNASAPVQPIEGLFPETLFHAIVKRAKPDLSGRRTGIVQFSSSLGAGGAERQVAYVIQGLSQGAEPCSLAVNSLNPHTGNDFFLPELEKSGCEVIDLDEQRNNACIRQVLADFPAHADTIRQLAALPPDASRIAIPFFGHLVQTRPRVVHLWQDTINIAAGMAAVAAGVPEIVLCTRSTRPAEISRFRRYLSEGYLALLGYAGRLSIVNNSANGAKDYEQWLGVPDGTIRTFYNGYDFDSIRAKASPTDRARIRKQMHIPEDAEVVGGVMRFSHEKRPELWVETLIAAIAQSDNTHGLIIGDGPMRGALMEKVAAADLAGRIHFAGRQSPVEPWMSAMDILFLSSATEGLPNVLIEAQALGVPVATMNVGGASEALLAGKTGLTLEEASPDELAGKIAATLQDKAGMEAMSAAAVSFVNDKFSLAAMVGTLNSIYGPPPEQSG